MIESNLSKITRPVTAIKSLRFALFYIEHGPTWLSLGEVPFSILFCSKLPDWSVAGQTDKPSQLHWIQKLTEPASNGEIKM